MSGCIGCSDKSPHVKALFSPAPILGSGESHSDAGLAANSRNQIWENSENEQNLPNKYKNRAQTGKGMHLFGTMVDHNMIGGSENASFVTGKRRQL